MKIRLDQLAVALGGQICSGEVLAPGPGHSPSDRSMAVRPTDTGLLVHSYAGDDWRECRDYVISRINARPDDLPVVSAPKISPTASLDQRVRHALDLWEQSRDPRQTSVSRYLKSRGLVLPGDPERVIRFHPSLKIDGSTLEGMIALFRDIVTNEPCGIHRTFLNRTGLKVARKMRGRSRGAAIKLDCNEDVSIGLHIGEGVETCIAARLAGFRPTWALGSVNSITTFPVLAGVEALTILCETDDDGASERAAEKCARRWTEAGREVLLVWPRLEGDLADVWREVAP
jgi:putative DNA primase/helicase